MEKVLWDLFMKTGNVNYYLLYNKVSGTNGKNNRRGNSIK